MPETTGSLTRHAAAAACLLLVGAATAAAQPLPPPTVSDTPASPDFISRYDFHLAAAGLASGDARFSWDTHFGGSLDVVDYVGGRAGIDVDYEAVLGDEFRAFDPNQGNYTLEAFASGRLGRSTEVVGMFHHVSRHLSDRPKRFAVAWNVLGARILKRVEARETTIDVDVEGGKIVQHSYVDYDWTGELHLQARRPIDDRASVFGRATGQLIGTTGEVRDRERQLGVAVEAGLRIRGRAGALELFAGFERRADADPIDRQPQNWALAGFRLLSR
jgi:hypothetical protein